MKFAHSVLFLKPKEERQLCCFRVGRTARGVTGTGHALLILRPEELGFLRYLKQAKVVLNEYDFSWSKIANIQPQLEKLIEQNYYLNKSAKVSISASTKCRQFFCNDVVVYTIDVAVFSGLLKCCFTSQHSQDCADRTSAL